MGMLAGRLDEVAGTVSAAVTATGTHLLAFTQCGKHSRQTRSVMGGCFG
ncbi:hypothetical protein [Actinomadura sp. BRA 177]|nr:hypothetical protein [Actinomadura sp. BRA 177]NVI87017.1 hypothetical protein [Actinomadura sp. BRA 177]